MFRSIMITFKQFLEEAKKKDKKPKPLYSKKHIMDLIKKQGGHGAEAIRKYNEENPNQGPREYKLGEDVQQRQQQLNQSQAARLQAEIDRVEDYKRKKKKRRKDADREAEIIRRIKKMNQNNH